MQSSVVFLQALLAIVTAAPIANLGTDPIIEREMARPETVEAARAIYGNIPLGEVLPKTDTYSGLERPEIVFQDATDAGLHGVNGPPQIPVQRVPYYAPYAMPPYYGAVSPYFGGVEPYYGGSHVYQVPVMAEGAVPTATVTTVATVTDFPTPEVVRPVPRGPIEVTEPYVVQDGSIPVNYETDRDFPRRRIHGRSYVEPLDYDSRVAGAYDREVYVDGRDLYSPEGLVLDPYEREPWGRDPYVREPWVRDPYLRDPYLHEPHVRDHLREPYVRDPYVHEPYLHEPYVHDPLVHDPLVHDPYVRDPYVRDPLMTEPYVHEPYVREPYVHEPYVREPYVREPYVREPYVREPYVREPCVREPYVREPYVREPYVRESCDCPLPVREPCVRESYECETPCITHEHHYEVPSCETPSCYSDCEAPTYYSGCEAPTYYSGCVETSGNKGCCNNGGGGPGKHLRYLFCPWTWFGGKCGGSNGGCCTESECAPQCGAPCAQAPAPECRSYVVSRPQREYVPPPPPPCAPPPPPPCAPAPCAPVTHVQPCAEPCQPCGSECHEAPSCHGDCHKDCLRNLLSCPKNWLSGCGGGDGCGSCCGGGDGGCCAESQYCAPPQRHCAQACC